MKLEEKNEARSLRKQGKSIKEIALKLGVAKSSVSLWVRDVTLTHKQQQRLTSLGYTFEVVERRRAVRMANTRERRLAIMKEAGDSIYSLSHDELRLIGISLYWGEGSKKVAGGVRLSNSDPAIIQIMMRFFREICNVPEGKFRGHVHTFSHLNSENAEAYWSNVSGISRKQLFKTYSKPSIASKNKKDSLPYGTFQIYVLDTRQFFVIMGWIGRIKNLLIENG